MGAPRRLYTSRVGLGERQASHIGRRAARTRARLDGTAAELLETLRQAALRSRGCGRGGRASLWIGVRMVSHRGTESADAERGVHPRNLVKPEPEVGDRNPSGARRVWVGDFMYEFDVAKVQHEPGRRSPGLRQLGCGAVWGRVPAKLPVVALAIEVKKRVSAKTWRVDQSERFPRHSPPEAARAACPGSADTALVFLKAVNALCHGHKSGIRPSARSRRVFSSASSSSSAGVRPPMAPLSSDRTSVGAPR